MIRRDSNVLVNDSMVGGIVLCLYPVTRVSEMRRTRVSLSRASLALWCNIVRLFLSVLARRTLRLPVTLLWQ